MTRLPRVLLLAIFGVALVFTGCNDDGGPEPGFPEGTVAGIAADGSVALFPTDLYTQPDPDRYTGKTVTFSSADNHSDPPWITVINGMADSVQGLDGFGTSAGAWINFSAPIDTTDQQNIDDSVAFGYFTNEDATEIQTIGCDNTADKTQITMRPWLPIPPEHVGFYLAKTSLLDAEGHPVVQNPTLRKILKDKDVPDYPDTLEDRIRSAAHVFVDQGLVESTDDIAAMAVFTTQSIYQTDLAVAQYIRNMTDDDIDVHIGDPCEPVEDKPYRRCTFTFNVPDFTKDGDIIPDDAVANKRAPYVMTAHAFLPLDDEGDYPIPRDDADGFAISIFGHGLGGNAEDAGSIAKYTAGDGMATVSISAPLHGDHPQKPSGLNDPLKTIMALFGIEVQNGTAIIHTKVLRDGWRHSNFDKLALIRALQTGVDFDGDGNPDLDANRLTYLGGSLGAIQGSELSALTDAPVAVMLAVAAGRLSDIVRYGSLFGLVNQLMFPQRTRGEILRALVLLQTAVEKGDGINWAPHVLQDRLTTDDGYANDRIPDLAEQISVPDGIVTAEAGMALARALGIPAIGKMPFPDPIITSKGDSVWMNHNGNTAALLQLNCIHRNEGDLWEESEHSTSSKSVEGMAFWTHAFLTLFAPDNQAQYQGHMELKDPYVILGEDAHPDACPAD